MKTVSSSLLDELQQKSEHPIYELEVLPVVIATLVWADFIAQSQVVYYLDNEAAKSAFHPRCWVHRFGSQVDNNI